jgi:hypothetical protein
MKICERVNKYIGSTSFQNRYEVLKTKPAPASLAELSVKVGVPLWIMTAPPEQTDAWPIGENVAPVHSDVEIETTIVALGREPGGGPCRHAGCIHEQASRTDHIGGGPKQPTGGLLAT